MELSRQLSSADPAVYWHEQFLYALSGLSWAVGRLGDEAGYAGLVHANLTHPTLHFPTEHLVRDLGSTWRAGDDEAISNAIAALEDEAGLREQGWS